MSQSIGFISGKGGVGKSTLAANIAASLALKGSRVILVDTDIGLRSQDALLGLESMIVYDIMDLAAKTCTLDQVLLSCPDLPNLQLLPAAQFSRVKSLDGDQLRKIVRSLKTWADFVLLDAPAGIERGFRNVVNAGMDQLLLVATPDDICVRDAERAFQILDAKHMDRPSLLVNRIIPSLVRQKEMMSAQQVADLLDLPLLGEIPDDQAVTLSVLRHALFVRYDCEAGHAVDRIAARLRQESVPLPGYGAAPLPFFRRLFRRPRKLKEVTPLDKY